MAGYKCCSQEVSINISDAICHILAEDFAKQSKKNYKIGYLLTYLLICKKKTLSFKIASTM